MERKDSKYCTCLFYTANAFSRVISRMADEEFSITKLAPSYAFLLMIVNEKPGVQPKEISAQMQLTPSTVTRLIDQLESKGYLTRAPEGKAMRVLPTEKSQALNKLIKEAWANLYRRYTALLGEEEARNLTNALYESTHKLEA